MDWFLFPSAEGNLSSISEAVYAPSAKQSMLHQRSNLCSISEAVYVPVPSAKQSKLYQRSGYAPLSLFLTFTHFPFVFVQQHTFIKYHVIDLTTILAGTGMVVALI
jgi:hypothetical protein